MIDIRCNAHPSPDRHDHRCQLYAGHAGRHAILVAGGSEEVPSRMIRTWRGAEVEEVLDVTRASAFAWAPGFPAFEDTDRTVEVRPVAALAPTPLGASGRLSSAQRARAASAAAAQRPTRRTADLKAV